MVRLLCSKKPRQIQKCSVVQLYWLSMKRDYWDYRIQYILFYAMSSYILCLYYKSRQLDLVWSKSIDLGVFAILLFLSFLPFLLSPMKGIYRKQSFVNNFQKPIKYDDSLHSGCKELGEECVVSVFSRFETNVVSLNSRFLGVLFLLRVFVFCCTVVFLPWGGRMACSANTVFSSNVLRIESMAASLQITQV